MKARVDQNSQWFRAAKSTWQSGSALRKRGGFTLLEILLALALVALVLVSMNTFVFSMGELWGRNADLRLFDQHTRAVTRFLERELRAAAFPPAGMSSTDPLTVQEVRARTGTTGTG